MNIRTQIYILILGVVFSCSQESTHQETILKEKLDGAWELVIEDNSQNNSSRPLGMAFSGDSVELFNGIFKTEPDSIIGKQNYRFFENLTKFKIESDSIFIQSVFDNSWNYWNTFINLKGDTLFLSDNGVMQRKFARLDYNHNTQPKFDQIVYSNSGCLGSCPMFNFSLNLNGEFLFHGQRYTDTIGLYKGKLSKNHTEFIFNKFSDADILNIDKHYEVRRTDAQTITITFILGGKIIRTIHDYGKAGPNKLVLAYIPISNAYKQANLDTIPVNKTIYPILHKSSFHRDSLILSLEKSESYYLGTELKKSRIIDTTFKPIYKMVSMFDISNWINNSNEKNQGNIKVEPIYTDGRYFQFYFENSDSITYDLGYNFIKRNFDIKNFRKLKLGVR